MECFRRVAIEVVQKSIETLVSGFNGSLPDLDMTTFTITVLLCAIAIKLVLWWVCARIGNNSSSADALAQDHRNDVFSNTVAVTTSLLAHYHRSWWYADSIGAIVISVYIAFSWLATGKEQVERLIGLRTSVYGFHNTGLDSLADNTMDADAQVRTQISSSRFTSSRTCTTL